MKKALAVLLAFAVSLVSTPHISALGVLPTPNEQQRHLVCTALSESARAYYTDDYRYDTLSTLSGAFDTATGYTAMRDNALFDALHTLMSDTHGYRTSYSGYEKGSLAYFWKSTDAVESSDTYVMFYSDVMADAEGIKLNREHIWPKSRASYVTKNGGSDLHHLRPAVDTLNNAKSDHLFGDINGVFFEGVKEGKVNDVVCYWVKKDADLFECKDDVKGDVARILLYVYCRWKQPNLYSDITPSLLPPDEDNGTNNGKKVVESLDTLLTWCEEDPVDTWEMRRNDLVESIQGNRNVFIDYPEYAWQLFGKAIPAEMQTPSSDSRTVLLGDADGDREITVIDATSVQRRLADMKLLSFHERAADVDDDHEITVIDATMIQRFLAGNTQPYNIGQLIR